MMYLKRTLALTLLLLLAIAVAACGSSTSSGSSSTSSTPTTAATTPTSSNAIVKTSTVTINGKSETVLTDAQGKTLYYFTPDTASTTACTKSCADNWPPLLVTGSASPTSATSLPGTLSMQTTANGNQVAYNGHFLYTFAGDSGPGQTKGQGLFGKWFVVTPDLASGNTSTGSGSNSTPVVKTSTATVSGKSETILTDAQGKTLYYFTPDTATTSACTGSCAQNWPPLLSTGSGTPTSATTLSGKLTVQTTANGSQIEYNGHLLYTFAADSAPGQTNGQGVLGKWFVATPTLSQ
jgi:predicted lipoprotein with Yx(FWY)xxD motif